MLPRYVPVRECSVHGGDAAWVLELPQVVERGESPALAELLLEAAEERRAPRLVAAALADELALQGVDRVDVVARPGRVGGAAGGQIGVDPGDVGVDVAQHRAPLLAVPLQHLGLRGDEGLRLRARLEALQAGGQVDGAQAWGID